MKKFEEGLKQKAHISKIKQAKTTILHSTKASSKLISSKVGAQAQLLLDLYDKKNYSSIPAYKLLRTSGLQQYTRGFIQRGYGINLGKLALISEQQRKKLYDDLKILPGHTVKLDKIIDTLAKSSYTMQGNESIDAESQMGQRYMQPQLNKLKITNQKDNDYQKQLQRVLNQYTPVSEQKKKGGFNTKYSEKRVTQNITQTKYAKTKYSAPSSKNINNTDFKKKPFEPSTKATVKKTISVEQNKKEGLQRMLKSVEPKSKPMSSKKIMEINLQIDKIKGANKSFDGALMTSTIANIDIEELIYAFSGFIAAKVVAAPEPKANISSTQKQTESQNDDIEDQVGQILKESFLHPLYKQQEEVQEDLPCQEEVYSEGSDDQPQPEPSFVSHAPSQEEKMMESSFLGGGESVDFGLSQPLKIFEEPQPTTIDYFKPTVDSVSNFIKNIVLTAKMQRQIPIMAAAYLQTFLKKTKLILTSLNYKRLLVTMLLLASKIWDDQSFQTPSFSKTFPQYSTILMNQMQKQVVKTLDYKLKIDKKQYTKIYFQMRKHTKQNIKSYQNKKLTIKRIRELQRGVRKDYKSYFMTKRNSY